MYTCTCSMFLTAVRRLVPAVSPPLTPFCGGAHHDQKLWCGHKLGVWLLSFGSDDVITAWSKHACHTQLGKHKAFQRFGFQKTRRRVRRTLTDAAVQCRRPLRPLLKLICFSHSETSRDICLVQIVRSNKTFWGHKKVDARIFMFQALIDVKCFSDNTHASHAHV